MLPFVKRGVVLQDFRHCNAGECVVLHGANGVGKSTIIETRTPVTNGKRLGKASRKVVCDGEEEGINRSHLDHATIQQASFQVKQFNELDMGCFIRQIIRF